MDTALRITMPMLLRQLVLPRLSRDTWLQPRATVGKPQLLFKFQVTIDR